MNSFWRGLLDIFYPPRCQVCFGFSSEPLCPRCRGRIAFIKPPVCRLCGLPLDPAAKGPDQCPDCRFVRRSPINWARSPGIYQGPLQRAILSLKFAGRRALCRPLADLLAAAVQNGLCPDDSFDFACPVPLHPRRRKERGFNQSELLARYFCEKTGLTLNSSALLRIRFTVPQVMLPPEHRRKNVHGAFSLSPGAEVKGKKVLLIDDIYTTGSTLKECAWVLRRGGAAAVSVLTLARPRPPWMTSPQPEE